MNETPEKVRWQDVETVLLDMDGTLLDLHFDNQFWLHHMPLRYAEIKGIPPDEAKAYLYRRYKAVEGTMDWYCLDYWTRELYMDVALLKEEVEHLIAVHPHVTEFLDALGTSGRRIVLVTNAHGKSLRLKMDKTRLEGRLDRVVCSHDLGLPKEDRRFWARLMELEPFTRESTLLVDDSLAVLRSAAAYGIHQLLAVYRPDSQAPVRDIDEFPAIHSFREIMPPNA